VAAGAETRDRLLLAALVVGAVAAIFGGALGHPFLPSHDDGPYILWNPVIRAAPLEALRGAFITTPLEAWAPLHLLSHVADHALWGEWAGGYVLVNLALHALNALLLGALVVRLGGRRLAGAAAALLFAVHPVQVEAVAWISQRKTVLSVAFILLALHLWVEFGRAVRGRRLRPWALSLAATVAALLTKAVAVVVPLALAALDLALGRARPRAAWVADKLPALAVAVAVAVITVATKGEVNSSVAVDGHTRAAGAIGWHGGSPLANFLTSATIFPRYLGLLLWPARLSAVYTPPLHRAIDVEVAVALLLLALAAAAGVWLARRSPRLFFWYALFFLGLLPVSQVMPQVTLMNDRYLYLPMLGAAALAGEGLAALLARLGPAAARPVAAAALAGVVALGAVAQSRVAVWRSDLALWSDAVEKTSQSPYAWFNLGRAREAAGEDPGALEAYQEAARLDPLDGDAAVNAGAALLRGGDPTRAAPLVEGGARILSGSVEAQFNLGLLRALQGRPLQAETALRRALELSPGSCQVEALLGYVLALTGRTDEAASRQRAAVGCAPSRLPEHPMAAARGERSAGRAP
jgi:tetratricopeptide (TPR) repeat protein